MEAFVTLILMAAVASYFVILIREIKNSVLSKIESGSGFFLPKILNRIKQVSPRYIHEQERLENIRLTMSQIDAMDGIQFENYVARVLKKEHFSDVQVTKASGDFGVDIIARKNGEVFAFQCKCYSSPLGVKPIQEVYAGAQYYGATKKIVVTNNYFTSHASTLAKKLGVELWDRIDLQDMCCTLPANKDDQEVVGLIHVYEERAKRLVPGGSDNKRNENSTPPVDLVPHLRADDQRKETAPETQDNNYYNNTEDSLMATVLGAGKYVFGVNIPMGMYNLKAISGEGTLNIHNKDKDDDYEWFDFGNAKDCAKEYNGLSLKEGQYFTVDGNVRFEISKAGLIEIE